MYRNVLVIVFFLSLCVYAYAQQGTTAPLFGLDQCLLIEDESGTVVNIICGPITVPDGTLTDDGDGSFTLNFSSGGGCWEEDLNSDLQPVSGSCTDTFWEQDLNNDLQPKT